MSNEVKSLREKKEQHKREWERCFEMKIEDVFTDESLERFWSDKTSSNEAIMMLDDAAYNLAANAIVDMFTSVINSFKEDSTTKKSKTLYEVERINDNHFYNFYDKKFETKEEAKEFIKQQAMSTCFTVDDFRIVKVCE